jgi:hypothetical protein
MARASRGSEPRACDICGAINAPFGYQPPGGARNLKPGRRPWRACINPDCRAKCEARLLAASSVARDGARPAKKKSNLQADLI